MTTPAQDGLLSPSDIAELADVTRGAVSNWRKRSEDFPAQVAGTSAKPLFSQQDVTAWLENRGHKPKQDAGQSQVWAVMNQLRGVLPPEQVTDMLLTLLVERKTGDEQQSTMHEGNAEVLSQVRTVVDGIDPRQLSRVADYALERLAKAAGRSGGHFGFVGSRTSTLLANLAAAHPGAVLYDPACGIGAALIQAVELGAPSKRVVGHDISAQSLQIAAQRAQLHDIKIELVRTDVLREDVDPDLAADVVILEPPFGLRAEEIPLADPRFEFGTPPTSSADTVWLQHAIAHLSQDGRGYVLTTPAALHTRRESEIRSELLRKGCIEAIIALPAKMLPHTSIPLALWVLRRPTSGKPSETVLLIDAAQTQTPEDDAPQWLTTPAARENVPHATVPVSELLADGAVLTPQRWVGQTAPDSAEIVAAYTSGWASIRQHVDQLHAWIADLPETPDVPKSRVVTIGELIEQGVLSMLVGRPKESHAAAPAGLRDRTVTAADVRDHTLQRVASDVAYDDYPDTTQIGDVLVTTMNTIRTVIDPVGGHLPSTGVHRLRVLKPEVITPAYLAHTLAGTWNERFQSGTTIQRAALRELEIPLVPVPTQNTIQDIFTALATAQKAAHHIATRGDVIKESLLQAVRYNKDLNQD